MNSHFSAPTALLHSTTSGDAAGQSAGGPLLIFRLGSARLAISALAVSEVHMMPLLSPLPQSAPFVIGIFDLRGTIVPVIDLNARLGQNSPPLRISDALIILDWNSVSLALLVDEVLAVNHLATQMTQNLNAGEMPPRVAIPTETTPSGAFATAETALGGTSFVAGATRIDGEIVLLLELARLLDFSLQSAQLPLASADFAAQNGAAMRLREQSWTPEEREILQIRALRRREAASDETLIEARSRGLESGAPGQEKHMPVAVFALGGEEFALPLGLVREFTWISSVASVPCCPPHILGQINLRGDIVTLLDVRAALHTARTAPPFFTPRADDFASPASKGNADKSGGAPHAIVPVVVVQHEGEGVGLAVDEVRDVLYLSPDAWSALDGTFGNAHKNAGENEGGKAARHRFFAGGATYQGRLLPFLDIGRLLEEGDLEVNETP